MFVPVTIQTPLDSTARNEAICLTLAAGLHALIFFWNPILMRSHMHEAQNSLISIELVDQTQAEAPAPAPVKKLSIMDTLRGMLATQQPEAAAPKPVALPRPTPMLQERHAPSVVPSFKPAVNAGDELAAMRSPDAIKTPTHNMQTPNVSGPTLKTRSFSGGIKANDLPFNVSPPETISAGESVIAIQTGRNSSKSSLAYAAPSLQDTGKRHVGMGATLSDRNNSHQDVASLGAASSQAPTTLAGTGGAGTAPTGNAPAALSQRNTPNPFGTAVLGSGRTTYNAGVNALNTRPASAAATEVEQVSVASSQKTHSKSNKGFEITGPLNNRTILHKVVPAYPEWAQEQGIVGSVRLYFTVTPTGEVRPNITVKQTTGYPQLDQLAIEALKSWKFAPLGASEEGQGEWGIITFNFSLTS